MQNKQPSREAGATLSEALALSLPAAPLAQSFREDVLSKPERAGVGFAERERQKTTVGDEFFFRSEQKKALARFVSRSAVRLSSSKKIQDGAPAFAPASFFPPPTPFKNKTQRTSLEPRFFASVWESITALMARSVKRSKTALTTRERRVAVDDADEVIGALPARSAAGREDPRARRAVRIDESAPAAATTRAERAPEARAAA